AIDVRRAVVPGQYISYAGSDIARGEVVLRRKTRLSSREIGMLAACGLAEIDTVRRPKVAVLSTGDELAAPGDALGPARGYDSNGAIIAAAATEAGGEGHAFVAPVIRARAGFAPEAVHSMEATVPVRIASELGRKEFVLVALTAGDDGPVAFPTAKGSGAVTSFSQADGFLEVDALAAALD